MKPNNFNTSGCTPSSSNCVIWDGPNVECLGICQGESVTKVVYDALSALCNMMKQLDISDLDLSCIDSATCKPKDFKAFLQLLINKVCETSTTSSGARIAVTNSDECPTCEVTLQPCFRYKNQTGDDVTTAKFPDYVQMIAVQVCTLLTTVKTQGVGLSNLNTRVTSLEKTPVPQYVLPSLFPVCIANSEQSLPLDVFSKTLEAAFCTLQGATGTADRLLNVSVFPGQVNLNAQNALGTSGGKMSSLPGWISDPKNAADTIQDLWATVMDLRSAVQNIKLNCCGSECSDIAVQLQVSMPSSGNLNFYFTGNIPAIFQNCLLGGSLFKISDQSGNFANVTIDVKSNINVIDGFTVNISGSPLNVADDFDIIGTLCFFNQDTNSQCQSVVSYHLINTLSCPAVTWTPGIDTISYSFDHLVGSMSYYVELYNVGNIKVASNDYTVTGPIAISGAFTGLNPNAVYKGRVQMVTAQQTKPCPFTSILTGADACPEVQSLTSYISIP